MKKEVIWMKDKIIQNGPCKGLTLREYMATLGLYPNGEEPTLVEEDVSEEYVDYSQFTVSELKHMATEVGIEFPNNVKRAELVELLTNFKEGE